MSAEQRQILQEGPMVSSRRSSAHTADGSQNLLRDRSQQASGHKAQSAGLRRPSGQLSRTGSGGRPHAQILPSRSTKVSEKLVLLPETVIEEEEDDLLPLKEIVLKDGSPSLTWQALPTKSYAEKLPKEQRTAELPRVTAFCTAQAYRMSAMASFVRQTHGARTKLYDECLYCAYHLPLMPGRDGSRIRSSPVLKSPGGRTVIDEEIERSEQRDYDEDAFDGEEPYQEPASRSYQKRTDSDTLDPNGVLRRDESPHRPDLWLSFAEVFIFAYGVTVMWNFNERQEKDLLADLTFALSETGPSLSIRPQHDANFETEELHFEYSLQSTRPRIFNDMITLRSGDHMIKLALSHALAQSTKLSYFEEQMATTMSEARHVPKRLALTGKLGLSREEVVKILGRLFKSRVDVNLSSKVLDDPRFFWESEPTLQPLYSAFKEYLEIRPRVLVLNERCRVFLELAEILTDSISVKKMSRITWIIIILIVISILVTVSEVFIRFGILTTRSIPSTTPHVALMQQQLRKGPAEL